MSSKAEQRKALERLKAARRGGVSRLTQYQASEEEALYEEVDEQEYRAMVDERRRNTFVVGDGGLQTQAPPTQLKLCSLPLVPLRTVCSNCIVPLGCLVFWPCCVCCAV